MKAKIKAFFKFKPIVELDVSLPTSFSKRMLVGCVTGEDPVKDHAYPFRLKHFRRWYPKYEWSDKIPQIKLDQEWMNVIRGKCGEMGWYHNGGWRPHGANSIYNIETKEPGDIVAVQLIADEFPEKSVFPYLDRTFNTWLLNDAKAVKTPWEDEMCEWTLYENLKPITQEMFDEFCEKSHDSLKFMRKVLHRELYDEIYSNDLNPEGILAPKGVEIFKDMQKKGLFPSTKQ